MGKPKEEIEGYIHCAQCLEERPGHISPRDFARLNIGYTSNGNIQVWCTRHDKEVCQIGQRPNEEYTATVIDGSTCH